MFRRFFTRSRRNESIAYSLYGAIVAQSRQPAFYADWLVPDTLDGRYDMIVLHDFLLFYRLKTESDADRRLGQAVFDIFLKDMDGALREMGVGDISVPKKLKKMAEVFYGRVSAYDAALAAGDGAALEAAIARNIFPEGDPAGSAGRMAAYVEAATVALAAQPIDVIRAGRIDFPAIRSNTASEAA
ncbi:ubiquinol-cytochrome C chaperone [Kaistia dalseonensis]|uniref:Cytochrome b pre-mRNA-processing protein 3 n=1 Tax=Kaistia dalseonensis TaxID=410840 RepID=A0ABU0H1L2_9HYPH|nr:ubiquinol-cytochrome C chaperone family protein [Kaistia dalseonensis]MCX5493630.1 ubiquinol-cytochrome C chaperone [Kaistia dalseonensis]MDQ0436191.1 cytochrome b pre-mRNA-processing protein 3 [Kaistia dalseonensis]